MTTKEKIKLLANQYADRLKTAIDGRVAEMQEDDTSHLSLPLYFVPQPNGIMPPILVHADY